VFIPRLSLVREADISTPTRQHIMKEGNSMPTFKNTSNEVFQDGDLVVRPGESFSTEEEARIDQITSQYAWQFSEGSGKAPSEGEVAEELKARDVRELRTGGHVEVDDEGKHSKKVGE
jgi:hypothetical protein